MPERLAENEITEQLTNLSGWQRSGDQIEKGFEFKDFAAALAFVNRVGDEAERMDHHPDLLLHSWNKVKITLTTHSAKGITENDIELARKIEKLQT